MKSTEKGRNGKNRVQVMDMTYEREGDGLNWNIRERVCMFVHVAKLFPKEPFRDYILCPLKICHACRWGPYPTQLCCIGFLVSFLLRVVGIKWCPINLSVSLLLHLITPLLLSFYI